MSENATTLPKYFKDEAGFCYVATALLAEQPGMTPWDGAVDANGFAAETVAEPAPVRVKPHARPAGKGLAKPPTEG